MNPVFVDTSALIALLVPSDRAHKAARRGFERLAGSAAPLITTSYVLVETYALLGRRFGRRAVQEFRESFAPLLDVIWVDRVLHEKGLDLLTERSSAGLSLVDVVSFVAARSARIDRAFAFDRDFEKEGFELVR